MSDSGCVAFAFLVIVILPISLVVWSAANQQKREVAARRERGERITELLRRNNVSWQQELLSLLNNTKPVGYFPELTQPQGWFEQALPALRSMLTSPAEWPVVESYFRCFTFPAGEQAQVLTFLQQLLRDSSNDAARLDLFKRLAGYVLPAGGLAEAQWLYSETLTAVRVQKGTPEIKAVALYVGRCSYSHSRPDKRPTVYDEQAIANDIAAQIT